MEYNVKIDKVDTQNMSYDSSAECLEITLEEYKHVTERANKYDNKIYIMITFCSVFFAFILTLLDKLVTLSFPQTTRAGIIFVLCIVLFIIISLCYISSMLILVIGLRPIKLHRFNPKLLIDYSLWNKPSSQANMLAVKQYTEFVLSNNEALENDYKKISIVTLLMSIVVSFSFVEYILLIFA